MPRQAILRWGNDLAFRLPPKIAKHMKISAGSEVTYVLDGSRLIIEPVAEALPPFTLADLRKAIRKIKPSPDPFGRRRGREEL